MFKSMRWIMNIPFIRYALALIAMEVALLARIAIGQAVGEVSPFLTFYPAVMFVALLWGFWPAIFATVIAAALCDYWLLSPEGVGTANTVTLGLFIINCVLITFIADFYTKARTRAESHQKDIVLKESNERLQQALGVSRSFTFDWETASDRVLRSDSCALILRLSGDEAIRDSGQNYFRRVHPEDRARFVGLLQDLRPGKDSYHTQYRLYRPDGSMAILEEVGRGSFDESGSLQRLIGTTTDITERKQAEETTARLAAIVESSTSAIISMSLDVIIESWNKGAERMFGYTAEEIIGKPLTILIPANRRQEEETFLELLRQGKSVEHFDTLRLTKDGREVNVSVFISPVRDEQGNIIGASKILSDVSERKRSEKELQNARSNAEHRANELEALMDAVPVGVMITHDADGRHISGNRRAHELLRTPLDESNISKAAPDPDKVRTYRPMRDGVEVPSKDLPIQRAAGGEEVRDWACDLHFDDGEVRHIIINATTLRNQEGQPRGAIAAFMDVTDRQRAEEALKEADRKKDEFLAVLAHELRNPMAAISVAAGILSRPNIGQDKVQLAKDALKQRVSQLGRLIEDLLDISRISRGKIELHRENLDLESVITRAVETSKGLFDDKAQQLKVHILDPLPVFGDPVRLEQIVTNLLTNASRYSHNGAEVSLSAFRDEREAVIQVRDNGIGIPANLLPNIFNPFTQAESSLARTQGGLGLGLTIVKNLSEMHNGSVSAKSDGENRGSEFEVRLPIGEPHPDAAPEIADGVPGRSFRILLVEDHPDTALMGATVLELEGHSVVIASDGPSAVKKALEIKPDIILLDIGLPGLSGYEVAEAVRGAGLTEPLIVAVTGYGQERDIRRAREAGIDHHLLKPIEYEKLGHLLAGWTAEQKGTGKHLGAALEAS